MTGRTTIILKNWKSTRYKKIIVGGDKISPAEPRDRKEKKSNGVGKKGIKDKL